MLYIATLEEMKSEVGIEDEVEDSVLTIWLEGLQDRIDDFLSRTLLRIVDETEYHDGGERFIYTKHWPIEDVSSIVIAHDQDWDNGTVLDSPVPDYLVNEKRGKISYATGTNNWPGGFQNVRTILTGGYVACDANVGSGQTAMPDWARRAMFMQCGFEWRNRETLGITQISAGGAAKQVLAGLPHVQRIVYLAQADLRKRIAGICFHCRKGRCAGLIFIDRHGLSERRAHQIRPVARQCRCLFKGLAMRMAGGPTCGQNRVGRRHHGRIQADGRQSGIYRGGNGFIPEGHAVVGQHDVAERNADIFHQPVADLGRDAKGKGQGVFRMPGDLRHRLRAGNRRRTARGR